MNIQLTDALPLLGVLLGGGVSLVTSVYVTNRNMRNNLLITNTQNRRDIYVKIANMISLFLTMDTRMISLTTVPLDPNTGQEIDEEAEDAIRKMIRELTNHWQDIAGEAYLYLPQKSTREIEGYLQSLDGLSDEIRDSVIYKKDQLVRIQSMTKELLRRLKKDIGVWD